MREGKGREGRTERGRGDGMGRDDERRGNLVAYARAGGPNSTPNIRLDSSHSRLKQYSYQVRTSWLRLGDAVQCPLAFPEKWCIEGENCKLFGGDQRLRLAISTSSTCDLNAVGLRSPHCRRAVSAPSACDLNTVDLRSRRRRLAILALSTCGLSTVDLRSQHCRNVRGRFAALSAKPVLCRHLMALFRVDPRQPRRLSIMRNGRARKRFITHFEQP